MSWGREANSKHRLDYPSLKKAIEVKGNRGHKGQVRCNSTGTAVARLDPHEDVIHFKLHHTDIITFYPNGNMVLRGGGWASSSTSQKWWAEARINVGNRRINEWTEKIVVYYYDGGFTPFYDGMRINMNGVLLSKPKPFTKNLPNAEAKALRKRMLKVFNEVYLPHLHMMSCKDGHIDRVSTPVPSLDEFFTPKDEYALINQVVLVTVRYWGGIPWEHVPRIFKAWLDRQYKEQVKQHQMFDVVPHQPKEK